MAEEGLVTKITKNMLTIEMSPLSNCGSCKACSAHRRSSTEIEVENTCNASVGDCVFVKMEQTILAGAIIFYGIPLLAFAVGILLGWMIAPMLVSESLQEPVMAAIGIFFLLISYLCIRLANPLIKRYICFPTVISIIPKDLEDEPKS